MPPPPKPPPSTTPKPAAKAKKRPFTNTLSLRKYKPDQGLIEKLLPPEGEGKDADRNIS